MEAFRSEFRTGMVRNIPSLTAEQINDVLGLFDNLTYNKYDMVAKTTALVVTTGYNDFIMEQYLATFYTRRKSAETMKNIGYYLKKFFDTVGKDADKVTVADVLNFFLTYRTKTGARIAPSSQNRYEQILNRFYDWCVKNNKITHITENPLANYEKASVPNTHKSAMTEEELNVFFNSCEDERERLICEFLFESGCRVSEMCNARKEDLRIDLEKDGEVPFFIRGKGNKDDVYFISLTLYNRIKATWEQNKTEYVFTNQNGDKLVRRTVEYMIHRIQIDSGLSRISITPHTFRHTAATLLVSKCGGTAYDVRLMLNHSSTSVSEKYIDQDIERRRKVASMVRSGG